MDGRPLRDEDLTRLRLQLSATYELRVSQQMIADVLTYVTRQKAIWCILCANIWRICAGMARPGVRMLLPRYAGTDDTELARVLSMRFVACVARAMQPGCKKAIVYWC